MPVSRRSKIKSASAAASPVATKKETPEAVGSTVTKENFVPGKDLFAPVDIPKTKTQFRWGQVRASPFGSCLDSYQDGKNLNEWADWRKNLPTLQV